MVEHVDHAWYVDDNRDIELVSDPYSYPREKVAYDQVRLDLLDLFLYKILEKVKKSRLMIVIFGVFWRFHEFVSGHAVICEDLVLTADLGHEL